MTAANGSYLGFAKQVAKGTPNVTDAQFDYLLFREGAMGVMPTFLPLDQEVGGGALLRNVLKVGVMSGGRLSIIPRPKTLGNHFYGVTGAVNSTDNTDGSYTHVFTLNDQFSTPWYTGRVAPGNLHGEQLGDMRYAGLTVAWRGGRFVEGDISMQGIAAPQKVSTASWAQAAKIDGGPQFIAPLGTIELPTGDTVYVTQGSFSAGISMPVDEQIVVGSYTPQDLSIVQRAYVLSLAIKINDSALYSKIMYDPAGSSSWLPNIFREADIKLSFKSDVEAADGVPYEFKIEANGESGANANVAWSAQPISMKAGRQLILGVTGTFLANPVVGSPLTLTLINQTAAY